MGRRKIEIKYIADDRNRSVTFIKRKNGLFKKAHELSILTGAKVTVHVEDIKERHFDFQSANLGGEAAAAFESDDEEEDEEMDETAGQQQQLGASNTTSGTSASQEEGQHNKHEPATRPVQAIVAARPGHRRTQSGQHLSPNQAVAKPRTNGAHPYPRSPKVPATPTMTTRPTSMDFSTPTNTTMQHAHRLSTASSVSAMELAQAMQMNSPGPHTGSISGQGMYYGQSPSMSEFEQVFSAEGQAQAQAHAHVQAQGQGQSIRPAPQQAPRYPPFAPPAGLLPQLSQQSNSNRPAKLEDFEGFEFMEEDPDASLTQASTPALYDYSANPSLTNLHAPPTAGSANAPGLGIVLEAGFDGYADAPTIDGAFHAHSQEARQQQQLMLMHQAQMIQARSVYGSGSGGGQHPQPGHHGYRRSGGFDPQLHQTNGQQAAPMFYGNASGAMSTPNLNWYSSAR